MTSTSSSRKHQPKPKPKLQSLPNLNESLKEPRGPGRTSYPDLLHVNVSGWKAVGSESGQRWVQPSIQTCTESHRVCETGEDHCPPHHPLRLLFNHYNASKDNWTSQWRRSIWAKWSLHINYSLELAPSRVNTIITRLKCGNSDTFIKNTRIHEIHRLIPLCYSRHRKFGLFRCDWLVPFNPPKFGLS